MAGKRTGKGQQNGRACPPKKLQQALPDWAETALVAFADFLDDGARYTFYSGNAYVFWDILDFTADPQIKTPVQGSFDPKDSPEYYVAAKKGHTSILTIGEFLLAPKHRNHHLTSLLLGRVEELVRAKLGPQSQLKVISVLNPVLTKLLLAKGYTRQVDKTLDFCKTLSP